MTAGLDVTRHFSRRGLPRLLSLCALLGVAVPTVTAAQDVQVDACAFLEPQEVRAHLVRELALGDSDRPLRSVAVRVVCEGSVIHLDITDGLTDKRLGKTLEVDEGDPPSARAVALLAASMLELSWIELVSPPSAADTAEAAEPPELEEPPEPAEVHAREVAAERARARVRRADLRLETRIEARAGVSWLPAADGLVLGTFDVALSREVGQAVRLAGGLGGAFTQRSLRLSEGSVQVRAGWATGEVRLFLAPEPWEVSLSTGLRVGYGWLVPSAPERATEVVQGAFGGPFARAGISHRWDRLRLGVHLGVDHFTWGLVGVDAGTTAIEVRDWGLRSDASFAWTF